MGTHLRNFFIALVTLSGITKIYQNKLQKKGPLLKILVFHDVKNIEWFSASVAFIAKTYHVLTPEDYMYSRFHNDRINVVLTFDDGYASWIDICLPILQKEDIKGLFFINSGLIDVFGVTSTQEHYVREQLLLSPRKTLSWDGVQKLRDAGHMIGGHTVHHARLATLVIHEQKKEISDDRERIIEMSGEIPKMFAYPFGQLNDYTADTEKILAEVGYTHAFTTAGVFVQSKNQYEISRLCLEEDMSTTRLGYWIEGGYDIYQKLKSVCVQ